MPTMQIARMITTLSVFERFGGANDMSCTQPDPNGNGVLQSKWRTWVAIFLVRSRASLGQPT